MREADRGFTSAGADDDAQGASESEAAGKRESFSSFMNDEDAGDAAPASDANGEPATQPAVDKDVAAAMAEALAAVDVAAAPVEDADATPVELLAALSPEAEEAEFDFDIASIAAAAGEEAEGEVAKPTLVETAEGQVEEPASEAEIEGLLRKIATTVDADVPQAAETEAPAAKVAAPPAAAGPLPAPSSEVVAEPPPPERAAELRPTLSAATPAAAETATAAAATVVSSEGAAAPEAPIVDAEAPSPAPSPKPDLVQAPAPARGLDGAGAIAASSQAASAQQTAAAPGAAPEAATEPAAEAPTPEALVDDAPPTRPAAGAVSAGFLIGAEAPAAAAAFREGVGVLRADATAATHLAPATQFAPTDRAAAQAGAIASQISIALANSDRNKIEIRLDPPELGRVSVSLSLGEEGARAVIAAERAEISDLLRRHGEMLQRDLSDAGFGHVNLEFSDNAGQGGDGDAEPEAAGALDAEPHELTQVSVDLSGPLGGRLDLRL